MRGYEEYKDTGIDWLPVVPKHWTEKPFHSFTSLSEERNGDRTDLELLSVYREYGVIRKTSRDDNHNVESQDLSNYKHVHIGDIVINKMKLWQGSLGVSNYEGIVSPAYIICKLTEAMDKKYLNYLLRSSPFKTYYNRISYGIRVGQWDSNYSDIKKLKLYFPTEDEQKQIVRYLDNKVSKINKLIGLKKKEIIHQIEYKQTIITKTLTKGLNDNRNFVNSEINWIGFIPEHWKVTKISRLYNIVLGKMLSPEPKLDNDTFENYLCAVNIKWSGVNTSEIKKMWFSESDKIQYLLNYGDVLITEGGEVGVSTIYRDEAKPCFIQNAVYKVFSKDMTKYLNKYLYYWMSVAKYSGYINNICNKATFAHYTKEKLSSTPILIIPYVEQKQIISYLDEKCALIDRLIAEKEIVIKELVAYKTRLISDVVTGKIDVRGIEVEDIDAASLIEDTTEEEPSEDDTTEDQNHSSL